MDERVSFFHVSAAVAPLRQSRPAAPAPRKARGARSNHQCLPPSRLAPRRRGALALKEDPNWQEF